MALPKHGFERTPAHCNTIVYGRIARASHAHDCRYSEAEAAVVEWLDARGIELKESPSPRDVLAFAVDVAEKYGVGRRALSNFDCFHYAHAKAGAAPLLTLDKLLRKTDVPTEPE